MRKLILASLTISSSVAAQTPAARPRTAPLKGSLEQRLAQLIDAPPFNRATWGIYVVDDRGRVLYQRNADRFSVPASNTKLVVTAAAAVLLPADYRVTTSLYVNGRVDAGVLQGDLILYGRGDPTWSARCYAVDTLAPGVCDSTFTAIDAIADSVRAKGIRRITGKLVGDGSYFEPTMIHYAWNAWDLTWWYAAPVSGLGFHDNSVDFRIDPRPESVRRAGARGVARAPRCGRRGRSGGHDRFARLSDGALLRLAARRLPGPAAPRHHLPDSQLEPELVRRDAAQDSGPGAEG